jgi:hypothetical protein
MHIPGNVVNTNIKKYLNGLSALKLSVARRNVRKPSQKRVVKNMLPRNIGRKPVNVKISRMTGRIPAHLPINKGGRYTRGHNTIQNWLSQYATNVEKQQRLRMLQNQMEYNQAQLAKKIKNRLNKITK